MLGLMLLFLMQTSMVLSSSMLPDEESFRLQSLSQSRSIDGLSLYSAIPGEANVTEAQEPPGWTSIKSFKEDPEPVCRHLEVKARELQLLLLKGQPKFICRLSWNDHKLVAADIDGIIKNRIAFGRHVRTELIKDGERGKVLVLPPPHETDRQTDT